MGYIDYINTSRTLIYNLNICSLNLSLFFGEGMRCGMASLQYKYGHSCHSYFYSIVQISPAKFVQILFPQTQLSEPLGTYPMLPRFPNQPIYPPAPPVLPLFPELRWLAISTRPEDAHTTENQRKNEGNEKIYSPEYQDNNRKVSFSFTFFLVFYYIDCVRTR